MNKKALLITLILINSISLVTASPRWYVNDCAGEFANYFIGKGFSELTNGNEAEAEKTSCSNGSE